MRWAYGAGERRVETNRSTLSACWGEGREARSLLYLRETHAFIYIQIFSGAGAKARAASSGVLSKRLQVPLQPATSLRMPSAEIQKEKMERAWRGARAHSDVRPQWWCPFCYLPFPAAQVTGRCAIRAAGAEALSHPRIGVRLRDRSLRATPHAPSMWLSHSSSSSAAWRRNASSLATSNALPFGLRVRRGRVSNWGYHGALSGRCAHL